MSFSDRSMRPVRDALAQQLPELELEKEFAISVGGLMFDLVDVVTVSDANISAMDRVQVAVYNVNDVGDSLASLDSSHLEAALTAKNDDLEWDTIVRVREENEQVWIVSDMDLEDLRLKAIAVVSFEYDELVLVNVDGKLDELIRFAMDPVSNRNGSIKI